MTDPQPCPTCHRLPLADDPRAADALLAAIRRSHDGRLHRTESLLAALHEEDRLAIAEWLSGMLKRPPLDRPTRAWAAIATLVDHLWWDVADGTPDPLSPVVDGKVVPQPHPRLFEEVHGT